MKLSYIAVIIQFAAMAYLVATNNLFDGMIMSIFQIMGLALGLWAVFMMLESKISIAPEIAKDATLVTSGPYKYIRHPMYSALFLICTPLYIGNFNLGNGVAFVMLFAAIIDKIIVEENMWSQKSEAYTAYKQRTKRFIPFLF